MHSGSLDFSWTLSWVLKLKSDHLGHQSTANSHLGPQTKNMIIWILILLLCSTKGPKPTTPLPTIYEVMLVKVTKITLPLHLSLPLQPSLSSGPPLFICFTDAYRVPPECNYAGVATRLASAAWARTRAQPQGGCGTDRRQTRE